MAETITEEEAPSSSPVIDAAAQSLPSERSDVRRFSFALGIGGAVVVVPYLWVLTDLWTGGPTLFRTVLPHGTLGNFYDLQGRAILAGHLSIAKGALGSEAFLHDGHQYTYYGILPSLIRIPVLLVTHDLDGRLTAISIFLAWVITGLMAGMTLWRCHVYVRGSADLGMAEAVTYAMVFVAIIGGSALINIAANPWVYSEDIAWSVALSLASLVAMLRVLERPSWGRIVILALAVLAVSLTRGTAGLGWSAGAVVTGLWFLWGRSRSETRRWWIPTVGAGVLPLFASFAVSWIKFGVVDGYPLQDQVYYRTNLASINHGHYFSLAYLPTGLKAYVLSLGVHFSSVFPFITLPQYPVQPVGHVALFESQQMTSLPGSMPLLFLLTLVGVFGILRPSSPARVRLLVIPFLAAAVPAGALLVFGFMDNRFVGDFLPLLVLGSAVGVAVLWERVRSRGPYQPQIAVGAVSLLCVYGVAANFGMSVTPTGWWHVEQTTNFVRARQSVGNVIGSPISSSVVHRKALPASEGPVGQIVIIGDCKKVVIAPSTGILKWLLVDKEATKGGVSCRSLLK